MSIREYTGRQCRESREIHSKEALRTMTRIIAALLLMIALPGSALTQERIKFPVGVSSKVLG